MPKKIKKRGIYCIEGFWEQGDVVNKASVLPLLELLRHREEIPYIHHRCGTKEEILYMLSRWKGRVQKKYPILYFATHGNEGELDFGPNAILKLEELKDHLPQNAHNCIIFFGSCFTMKKDRRHITRFLENTGALAAIGYTEEVDWMVASSVELLTLYHIQTAKSLDSKGISEIEDAIKPHKSHFSKLGFRLVKCKTHIPRRRK